MHVRSYRSTHWLRLVLLLTSLFPAMLAAQPSSPVSKGQSDDLIIKKSDGQGKSATFGQDLPPLERAVDPALYRVGPNDQLLLSIPLIEPGDFQLVVSVDNTILLPRGFPLINVKGMTLARLREVVDSLYRARSASYRNVNISLVKPRSIYVSVTGDVLFPDRYVMTAADRPTTAIDIANRISQEGLTKQREEEIAEQRRRTRDDRLGAGNFGGAQPTQRWVTLRHNDGSIQRLDLMRYRALGDESQNPTLREGDELIVHSSNIGTSTISAVGAVNSPATMPFSDGDNALMLYRLSGGVREGGVVKEAYIARRTAAGLEKVPLNLEDSASLASTKLAAGDQFVVVADDAAVTGGSRVGAVSVVGEVERPAVYPIVPGVTTLSELITMAGGVKPDAALNGAYITRAVDSRFQKPASVLAGDPGAYISASSLALDDTTRMKFDLENQRNRVSADFVEIVGRGNKTHDVPLEHGDEVVIPPNPKNVFVRGRVQHPGWVAYAPGAQFDYYITMAGGFIDAAVPGRSQVLKFGSGIWDDPGHTTIMPGDEIYVPGERDLPGRTSLEIAGTIVGITGGIASLAFTIFTFVQQLTKK
ncbi:MAG TPA: SLBB domain-containing protein [Candidatus Kapabacteria bacterium]|nr:SLBB domain-containing protein [Candidatus Kapabacteria bacterium]